MLSEYVSPTDIYNNGFRLTNGSRYLRGKNQQIELSITFVLNLYYILLYSALRRIIANSKCMYMCEKRVYKYKYLCKSSINLT